MNSGMLVISNTSSGRRHAAIAHSTDNGWLPERYYELGAGWVVRSHQITYLRPALEGDELIIRTWVARARSASSTGSTNPQMDGEVLARA